MDLSDSELYWTRKRKGLASEKETEKYIKILENRVNNFEKIEREHQKENRELREKIKELEKDISEMYYKGVVLDILQDELNISRDEAVETLKNY